MVIPSDAAVALLSGLALVVVGSMLAALRPRSRPQLFLAAVAALWGCQVVAANLGRVAGPGSGSYATFRLASFALLVPTFLFVAHFTALAHPRARTLSLAFGAWAAVAAAVLAAAPGLVLVGTMPGPAAFPLFTLPFYVAFYASTYAAWLHLRQSAAGPSRERARLLLMAFALFASYASVRNLLDAARGAFGGGAGGAAYTALFLAGAVLVVVLLARVWAGPADPRGRDRALVAAFVAPMAVAALEAFLAAGGLVLETLGLWRLAAVGALAYAVARHQLFDLDLRLKEAAGHLIAGAALAVAGTFALVALASGSGGEQVLVPLLAGAVAAAGIEAARGPLGERLFPGISDAPDYLRHRRLQVYRATLERALADQRLSADEQAELRALRRSLALSDREHEVLEYVVRTGQAPGAPPRAAPGALLLGRYRVQHLLGEGGHGRAYLARDEQRGQPVVAKAVGTGALGGKGAELLLREARLAGGLRHPNIVAVLDAAAGPDEALVVMEFMDGGSLQGLLRRRGRLGLHEAAHVLDQVLAGLEAAHAKGIVHQDLKPENILLARDGTAKVADFGVARDGRDERLTALQGAGTLLYMSPEQVRGGPVDHRSDLYAAGVVFYLALTGRFYLRVAGKDDFEVRQAILRAPPARLGPEQPAWVRAFVAKALAKDPAKRFQSAAAMRTALRPGLLVAAG